MTGFLIAVAIVLPIVLGIYFIVYALRANKED